MVACPLFGGQVEEGQPFLLMAVPAPGVEVIATDAEGSQQHILRTVPVRVGLHASEFEDRVQNVSRIELVGVAAVDGVTLLACVRRRRTRNQDVEVGPLKTPGKEVDGE